MRGTKYSPLDQINAANFNKLEVAWRFKTDNLGTRPEYKLEGTPLAIKGVLYTTAGTRRSVVALDGRTGELIWSHSYREGNRAAIAPRQLSGRGVSYWTDGKGDERILYVTTGYRLIALNAKNGAMIPSFGENGVVDLKKGAVFGKGQQIDLETGEIGLHSTPTVVKDVVIVGSSFKEGMTVKTHNNTKGLVRAFDVKSGKLLWTFNTIPRPGEFGNDTWENESWAINGNTGVWTQITVDEEAGLVYLPVEIADLGLLRRPSSGQQPVRREPGVRRPEDRPAQVALPVRPSPDLGLRHVVGARCSPTSTWTARRSRPSRCRASRASSTCSTASPASRSGRSKRRRCRRATCRARRRRRRSRFRWRPSRRPTRAPFVHVPDDLIDFTPELRAEALENLKRYRATRTRPYVPLGRRRRRTACSATLNIGNTGGGTNWPGGGARSRNAHLLLAGEQLARSRPDRSSSRRPDSRDIRYVAGVEGPRVRRARRARLRQRGRRAAARRARRRAPDAAPHAAAAPAAARRRRPAAAGAAAVAAAAVGPGPQGLPLRQAAVRRAGRDRSRQGRADVAGAARRHAGRGAQSSRAEGPEHPEDRAAAAASACVVTKTLVVVGDPQVTTTPDHPRGAMLRAYDKQTGKEVGAVWMPAPQSGSPMTYKGPDGRQYIIVAVSGGNYSGEYIAFALPQSEMRPTTQP